MSLSRRDFLRLAGVGALGAGMGVPIRWVGTRPAYAADASPATHLLNRITFCPRADDVSRVEQLGVEGYIDWQLWPEQIPDPLVDDFTAKHPFMSMTYPELARVVQKDGWPVFLGYIWARMYRAAFSERQLHEAMVEFWTDHFNVPFGDSIAEKVIEDRDVIRKHAVGKFRDLLFASAQSPAMMYYLNQASSTKEHPNENYARELMELHTLGVSGGYTERDVKEVARALTGWTLRDGWPGLFFFDKNQHDDGEKTILGVQFAAGRGVEDGLDLLDILARHAATAQFVSHKLCRRFVSDNPPQSLVESTAAVFTATEGDIRMVMRHILLSAEFAAAQGQKFRRPIDFVAAAMRVMRPEITEPWVVYAALGAMGQLPFSWTAPNGYPDAGRAWMNTNNLLARWNFALAFTYIQLGWVEGVKVDIPGLPINGATAGELVDSAIAYVFPGGQIASADREQLISLYSDGVGAAQPVVSTLREDKLPVLLSMLLASPYFQWR